MLTFADSVDAGAVAIDVAVVADGDIDVVVVVACCRVVVVVVVVLVVVVFCVVVAGD